MKPLSAFYDWLLPELPGCATPLVDLHLLDVAREYCQDTRTWRVPLSIELPADADSAALFSPEARTRVVAPLQLEVGGSLWWAHQEPEPSDCRRPRYRADQPPFAINVEGDTITFTDRPESTAVFTAAIAPAEAATQLPDFLLTGEHRHAVRKEVLSRLLRMGGKPWSNPMLAVDYQDEATALRHLTATRAARGNAGGLLRTTKTII